MPFRLAALTLTIAALTACSSHVAYSPTSNEKRQTTAVNINTANVDELELLPHVGPKTAVAIVEFRTQNGPFRRPEMLLQIRGMSEAKFAEIEPYIRTE